MLAPATPHIAEEFWNMFGGKDLLAALEIPILSIEPDDLHNLAEEEYVKNIISSARNLRNLAERHQETDFQSSHTDVSNLEIGFSIGGYQTSFI